MTSYSRVAAVTGGNKGIGLAIVRQLALQYPKSQYNNGPLLIYLTARDQGRGEKAVQEILNDADLKKAKALSADGGPTDVKFHPLDITQTKSIQDFSAFLKKQHPDGIDILINNAGIAEQGFDNAMVKKTLECNYYGTLESVQDVLPIIRDGGRLVNVASIAGLITKYQPALQEQFRSVKTIDQATKLMEDFKQAVADDQTEERGWTKQAYSASKAGVIAFTRAVAADHQAKGGKTLINACCPGYVDTDMTKHRGHKTPDEGAKTPILLALGDIGGQTGKFWSDEKVHEW